MISSGRADGSPDRFIREASNEQVAGYLLVANGWTRMRYRLFKEEALLLIKVLKVDLLDTRDTIINVLKKIPKERTEVLKNLR